jgi:predicted CoA-substrate-specific enzyme activase
MICAGIDAGSRTIKVVLLDADTLETKAAGVADQGVDQDALALRLLESLLQQSAIRRGVVRRIVATGYGRKLIPFADATVTEITCQAWGVRHRVPDARTIIDIGGQDSKLLRLNPDGRVADFVMNDRCAAGTGRFLEVVATRLGVKLPRLGEMATRSRSPATISSMCVVFAETEITGLLASGTAAEEIAAGVQAAIATRTAAMAGSDLALPILFTGGVAMVPGVAAALETALRKPVAIAPDPQMTCALGAAILASRRLEGASTTARQGAASE